MALEILSENLHLEIRLQICIGLGNHQYKPHQLLLWAPLQIHLLNKQFLEITKIKEKRYIDFVPFFVFSFVKFIFMFLPDDHSFILVVHLK